MLKILDKFEFDILELKLQKSCIVKALPILLMLTFRKQGIAEPGRLRSVHESVIIAVPLDRLKHHYQVRLSSEIAYLAK